MKPFYIVWDNESYTVKRRHETEAEAREEAERLALKECKTFTVLRAVGCVKRPENLVWQEYKE